MDENKKEERRKYMREWVKKWRKDNPEKWNAVKRKHRKSHLEFYREKARIYYKNNPERYKVKYKDITRNAHLKHKYGIGVEDYNKMFTEQNGLCAICGIHSDKTLHVDHCHTTNKVRGLLCFKCNNLLGSSNDRIDVLKSAIKYLTIKGVD